MSSEVEVDSDLSIEVVWVVPLGMFTGGTADDEALLAVEPLSLLLIARLASVEVGGASVTDGGTGE